jgi:tRNA(Ile)-lysidine synthase
VEERIEELLYKKLASLAETENLAGETGFLIAFSGGADSTALLAASSEIRKRDERFRFEAVHIDHLLRPESERRVEQELIRRNCAFCSIPLHIAAVRPGEIAEIVSRDKCGTEAAARTVRYALLAEGLEKRGLAACLLAHTLDDQVETLLQRLFEGAGSDSALGIPEHRGHYFRPFLSLEKEVLIAYLREKGMEYSTDSTNKENIYLRNRIRNRLIPAVEAVFPSYREGIKRFLEKQEMVQDLIKPLLIDIPFKTEGTRSVSWDRDLFFSAPHEARRRFLYRVYPHVAGRAQRLSYPQVRRIIRMDLSGETLIEAHGSRVSVRGSRIFWNGVVVLPGKNGYIKRIRKGKQVDIPGCGPVLVTFQGLKPPVIVRSRIGGDTIFLPGGQKKIKKLFQEWGVPETLRDFIPVLEDREGIAAVFGNFFGFPDRYAAGLQKYGTIKMESSGEPRK